MSSIHQKVLSEQEGLPLIIKDMLRDHPLKLDNRTLGILNSHVCYEERVHTHWVALLAQILAIQNIPEKVARSVLIAWVQTPLVRHQVYNVTRAAYSEVARMQTLGVAITQQLPKALEDCTPSAQAIYSHFLKDYGYLEFRAGYAELLSKPHIRMSKPTLIRAIRELQEQGFLALELGGATKAAEGTRGANVATVYKLHTEGEREAFLAFGGV